MSKATLTLEVLSGPLDGQRVTLTEETPWSKQKKGPLSFPWDAELGDPQARFFREGDAWWIEAFTAPHGTYRVKGQNQADCIGAKTRVEAGDIFKASGTWLEVVIGEARR